MNTANTFNQITTGVAQAIIPLKTYFNNSEDFTIFMKSLGWDLTTIPPPISNLNTSINLTIDSLNLIISGDNSIENYIDLAISIENLTQNIYNLKDHNFDSTLTTANFKNIFPKQLLDYIIIDYLKNNQHLVSSILEFLGIISYQNIVKTQYRPFYILKEVKWKQINNLFTAPESFLKNTYAWQTENFNSGLLFTKLSQLLWEFGIYSTTELGNRELLYKLSDTTNAYSNNSYVLNLSLFNLLNNDSLTSGNFQLFYLPKNNLSLPGIGLRPIVQGQLSKEIEIGTNHSLLVTSNLDINGGIALIKRPNENFVVKTGFDDPTLSQITGQFSISLIDKNISPKIILGDEDGSRIEYGSIDINLIFELNTQQKNELRFEVPINKLRFILDTSKGDSFINKVMPENGITLDMDIVLGYSTIRGFYFQGSGGLEYKLPLHKKIGPILLDNGLVGLRYKNNLLITASADVTLSLGPIIATINNIGMSGEMSIGNNGGLGGVDFKLGFKPPTGVGLSIDAPPVKGGGFLNYDEATSTYTGGLELNFSKISFSAIGILSTKLPGGDSGYSLLIIISAEFTPLQIGMGFTINGVGGLLGLNRTSNADVLRSGIRYNTLDHILFPKDIIKNANAIISTVGQAFPVLKDQFVVGPMAKINWGTPALLTIELGIIIELPDPLRLLILGILKAQLPNEKNAILKIQVNFLGVIDFKEKYLSFDATLYDSKILSFGLYGDMALRLNWGNRPNFLLSVGGFHPSYTPPPLNLPAMQRLTIVLADSKNLKIAVETYFAITSNSAQFGASVYAMARAWKVQAIGALWFDVLFQFSPFYFNANMGVKFAIKMGRRTLLSLYIELSLEGPEPWRAKGSGSFKVLFVRVRIRFNATFGSQRVAVIQAVAIDSKIKEALKSADNWEFILPERNSQMVTWRKESPTENLSVDPAGTIKISQRLLPLNTLMSKFGSSAISDFNRYTIKTVSIDSSNLPIKKVQDYFARNEFAYMSDDDKLSRDGYELFDSGVLVGSEDNISANYVVHKACGYENIILDAGRRRHLLLKFMLTAQRLRIESTFGYIGSSKLSTSRSITISGGPNRVNLSTLKGEFVLANRNNLKRVAPSVSFANSIQAEQYLSEQRTLNPNSTADWIIANRYELV